MKNRKFSPFLIYIIAMFLIMSWISGLFGDGTDNVPYSDLVGLFQDGQVKSFEVQDDLISLKLHKVILFFSSPISKIGLLFYIDTLIID